MVVAILCIGGAHYHFGWHGIPALYLISQHYELLVFFLLMYALIIQPSCYVLLDIFRYCFAPRNQTTPHLRLVLFYNYYHHYEEAPVDIVYR